MEKYNFKKIERKWQKHWESNKSYRAKDFSKKLKYYCLVEFPYPSGDGLHVGHTRSYTAMDIIVRKRRMEGYNVLYPIGWDAFGLPTENFAIKSGIHPKIVTKKNTDNFRRQLKSLGFSFDWDREINTTDPKYYKWTQWIFLQLYKKGLAYKKKMPINWCLSCKIGLANEEVVDGKCERCKGKIEKREKEQWMLAITKYADRLLNDLDGVDYLEKIKIQQANWIGKSCGVEIIFPLIIFSKNRCEIKNVKSYKFSINVFTTRIDTIFGCTYLVIAPENKIVSNIKHQVSNIKEVNDYINQAKKKSDLQRTDLAKIKTGVELKGVKAINPFNNEEVPIFMADYVLTSYGTGAIMAVPAHDKRDFEFAKKYKLPIKGVVIPVFGAPHKDAKFRKTISAIVQRKSDGKFLFLKWKKFRWISPVIGGIENKDTPEKTAEKEIFEETGYKARAIKRLGGEIESNFFADNKNVWRQRLDQPILLELESEKPEGIKKSEAQKHEVIWLTAKEILQNTTHEYNKIGLLRYINRDITFCNDGKLINSGQFNGFYSEKARQEMTIWLEKNKLGKKKVQYKLRDWIFSRQHYWGEPVPLIFCPLCKKQAENPKSKILNSKSKILNPGWISVLEKDLPVELPNIKKYEPTDTGESPLANIKNWVNVKCPKCNASAKRETDTMPNWAGSSWYYIAYLMRDNPKSKIQKYKWDKKRIKYWMSVDWYNGGMEHTTLHILYSRFWNKFLYDIGVIPISEPYKKRTSHGIILGEDGEKMSKSKGNVVNPDDMVVNFGADAFRLHQMFMGPFEQAISWDLRGIEGIKRFLGKIWGISQIKNISEKISNKELEKLLHKTIKKVDEDIEAMNFNTAVSSLMIFINKCYEANDLPRKIWEKFLIILSPFAPHIAEELWQQLQALNIKRSRVKVSFLRGKQALGKFKSINQEQWPKYNSKLIIEDIFKLVIQVDGKIRDTILVKKGISQKEAENFVLSREKINHWLKRDKVKKIIFIPNRLINIVLE